MDFKTYLQRYVHKDTPTGDFARDALADRNFPMDATYKKQLEYLESRACSEATAAFKQIWRNYRRHERIGH